MKKAKMNTKNLMVSFVAIMALILVATSVSAYIPSSGDLAFFAQNTVTVNGIEVSNLASNISVVAGETATIKVYFTAENDDTDVTITAEIEGDKEDTEATTTSFDVEQNSKYRKVLDIKIPELKDEISGTVVLKIDIEGDDHEEEFDEIVLKVQRPSYNVDFKSVNVDEPVEAGETMSVDLLVKNTGYNDLDDLEVTVRIPTLGIEKTQYFGDLVSVESDGHTHCEWVTTTGLTGQWECDYDDDDTDTMSRRMNIEVPYGTEAGTYALEVEVSNDDAIISKTVQFVVTNGLPETVIKSGNDLIVVNPTNKVAVYRVVYNEKEVVESVNAGQSIKVPIEVPEGEYNFDVNVFSVTGDVIGTVNYSGKGAESTVANFESPVVILTVVLAIIFLVLLVVLIVLVTKKPEKAEEFGESYY